MTAGAVKYSQSALDVEACSSATHAVVPEGTMDIPVALRLEAAEPDDHRDRNHRRAARRLQAGRHDLRLEHRRDHLRQHHRHVGDAPRTAQRNTRAELIAWIDKYFRMFPRGVCNTVSSCRRLENGGGSFNCTDGASCAAGQPTGTPAMTPRILLADPETGIGVGMTMFMGNTDMHMFKMYGGQVYAVHAVLGGATSSGWE